MSKTALWYRLRFTKRPVTFNCHINNIELFIPFINICIFFFFSLKVVYVYFFGKKQNKKI